MSNNASPPSTRKRTSPQSQNRSASGTSVRTENLPPSRNSASLRTVSPPLASTRLSRLIYLLVGLTTLLCAFYSYRTVQYKREVGGWWNLALGKSASQVYTPVNGDANGQSSSKKSSRSGDVVEDRINALADALGMPSNELASAIASAVRSYVPPASLSSVAAKQTGEAVNVLVSEPKEGAGGSKDHAAGKAAGHGVVDGILHGVESFAGLDEPTVG